MPCISNGVYLSACYSVFTPLNLFLSISVSRRSRVGENVTIFRSSAYTWLLGGLKENFIILWVEI